MNDDFTLVRDAFAESAIGRVLFACGRNARSAWRTSRAGRAARWCAENVSALNPPGLVGSVAVAIAIAAALQPLARLFMPRTIVPALPWPAYAIVAIFAVAAYWQRAAVVAAWPESRIARWLRR